jgi:hypothetical protein
MCPFKGGLRYGAVPVINHWERGRNDTAPIPTRTNRSFCQAIKIVRIADP